MPQPGGMATQPYPTWLLWSCHLPRLLKNLHQPHRSSSHRFAGQFCQLPEPFVAEKCLPRALGDWDHPKIGLKWNVKPPTSTSTSSHVFEWSQQLSTLQTSYKPEWCKQSRSHWQSYPTQSNTTTCPCIRPFPFLRRHEEMRGEQDRKQHPQNVEGQDEVLLTKSNDPILQGDVHLSGLNDAFDGWTKQNATDRYCCCQPPFSSRGTKDANTAKGPQGPGRAQCLKISSVGTELAVWSNEQLKNKRSENSAALQLADYWLIIGWLLLINYIILYNTVHFYV